MLSRIKEQCRNKHIAEPVNFGTTKLESFNHLLAEGRNIAVTHCTFRNATEETLSLLQAGEYSLFLDETIECFTEFNNMKTIEEREVQKVNSADVKLLEDNGIISIEETGKIIWNGGETDDEHKFMDFANYAKKGQLYYSGGITWCVFPPELFSCFNEIYVMTYLFEGSDLKWFLDFFQIDYQLKSVVKPEENYVLTDYNKDLEKSHRTHYNQLITICNDIIINSGFNIHSLSKSWYDKNINSKKSAKLLQRKLRRFFERIAHAKASGNEIMWTCIDSKKEFLAGKGYTTVRTLTRDEWRLPEAEREKLEKSLSCFVPLNARATNDYSVRWALAYMHNMNINPAKKNLLLQNGVTIDKDMYALSCLIQWMFRSRIRKGESIIIYIPNPKMRQLLDDWLECRI